MPPAPTRRGMARLWPGQGLGAGWLRPPDADRKTGEQNFGGPDLEKNEKKSILLRLSPKLWQELNLWAEDEFRSLNGQIEFLLSQAVKKAGRERKGGED